MTLLISIISTAISLLAYQSGIHEPNNETQTKNIILLIGDGMGLAQVQTAMTFSKKPLNIERCATTGLAKTGSSDDYITDSAAAATAIACGVKTYNGAIGVDSEGNAVKSILAYAADAGLATGLVATSTITHATPASFIAHNASRDNHEAIALNFIETDIDVFIGGGLDYFNQRQDQVNLLAQLKEENYQVVLETEDLEVVNDGKIAGLLDNKNLPSLINGRDDMLIKSSEKAIDILSQNQQGFFLMIEGSQIDWGAHDNNTKYMVTELLEFDLAVGMALDFAEKDGNTLVIITADHETGGLTIFSDNITGDSGQVIFSTTGHSAVMVPVYAYGPQADKFSGIYENNLLFNKMMAALGLRE